MKSTSDIYKELHLTSSISCFFYCLVKSTAVEVMIFIVEVYLVEYGNVGNSI